MDVARPYAIFTSPLDVEVLLVLRRTTRPFTGREVSRLVTRGSEAGVRNALRRLAEQGLVKTQDAGQAVLYTLNRDHLANTALEALATMRADLQRRLQEEIAGWEVQPEHISLFGSAARGDGDTRSDLDLFVVRPDAVEVEEPLWRNQLEQLAEHVYAWTGNHLAVSEVGTQDLRRLRSDNGAVVEALRSDAITLGGRQAVELLGDHT